jgi:hypothetical protein
MPLLGIEIKGKGKGNLSLCLNKHHSMKAFGEVLGE